MNGRHLVYGRFSVRAPDGWDDITSTLDEANAPITIASPESGVGALQFSTAIFRGGKPPDLTHEVLEGMLNQFAHERGLGLAFDHNAYFRDPGLLIVGASFHSNDEFVRVWYISDGKSVILGTYVCDWNQKEIEASAREETVGSVCFQEETTP